MCHNRICLGVGLDVSDLLFQNASQRISPYDMEKWEIGNKKWWKIIKIQLMNQYMRHFVKLVIRWCIRRGGPPPAYRGSLYTSNSELSEGICMIPNYFLSKKSRLVCLSYFYRPTDRFRPPPKAISTRTVISAKLFRGNHCPRRNCFGRRPKSVGRSIKIWQSKQATFFRGKIIWAYANPITELGARGYQRASSYWGGPPPRILGS